MQDLLSKILVAEPNDRYTIKNIIQHPWFQTDLPSRALKMNDDYIQLTPEGQGFQQLDEIKDILNQAKVEPKTVRKKEVCSSRRLTQTNTVKSLYTGLLCTDFRLYLSIFLCTSRKSICKHYSIFRAQAIPCLLYTSPSPRD